MIPSDLENVGFKKKKVIKAFNFQNLQMIMVHVKYVFL